MVVLRYRPDGALIRKTVTCGGAPSPCAATDRRYFYSGLQLMEVHDLQASRLIARYYYADDEVPLAADLWDAGAQALQPYAFLTDHAGSVIGLVDDQGQRVERVRYDTFGRPVVEAKDAAAPQVAQVLYDGNDVHVVFTEPVFAPVDELVPQVDITEKLVDLEYLLQWWDHTNTPLAGTWAFDTDVPGTEANTTLTFTPSAPLDTTKTHTLHIPPGALQDDWANDAALTLPLPAPSAGNYTGPAAGSTAQPRLGRSTTPNELFFQSHLWIADAGLYHMKARAYDPSTGLFLQRDPVAYVDALNLYAGFGWDPVNNRDPTGEWVQVAVGAAIGAGVGFLIEGGRQAYNWELDAWRLAGAGAGGAVYGSLAGATFGTSIFAGATVTASDLAGAGLIAVTADATNAAVSGEDYTVDRGAKTFLFNALTAGVFQRAGAPARGQSRPPRQVAENASRRVEQRLPATRGGVRFAQRGVSSTFRHGEFAGRAIDDVAAGLRSGAISPGQLPIQTITRDGVTYTLNNRSLMALRQAGLEPTVVRDVTGNAFFEGQLTQRLGELGGQVGPDFVPIIRGGN